MFRKVKNIMGAIFSGHHHQANDLTVVVPGKDATSVHLDGIAKDPIEMNKVEDETCTGACSVWRVGLPSSFEGGNFTIRKSVGGKTEQDDRFLPSPPSYPAGLTFGNCVETSKTTAGEWLTGIPVTVIVPEEKNDTKNVYLGGGYFGTDRAVKLELDETARCNKKCSVWKGEVPPVSANQHFTILKDIDTSITNKQWNQGEQWKSDIRTTKCSKDKFGNRQFPCSMMNRPMNYVFGQCPENQPTQDSDGVWQLQ